MTVRSLGGLTALCLVLAAPAFAAPATSEEAARLTTLFQRYVGAPASGRASSVTVTPSGDSYRAELDLTRLMAPLSAFGLSVASTSPYAATLTPQADGTWHVRSDDFPAIAFTLRDQTTTLKYENYRYDGVFDPRLGAMRDLTTSMTGLTAGGVSSLASTQQQYTAAVTGHQTGRDAGNGSVDLEAHQTAANLDYKITMQNRPTKDAPQTVSFALGAKAPSASTDTALSHLSMTSILDLWAFLVAHPSKAALKADQAGLKSRLHAVLDADPHGSASTDVQKLAMTTPIGTVALDRFKENLEIGDKASGRAAFGLHYAGLSVPVDRLPPWAPNLMPTALDLDLAVGPLHLNEGLGKAVTALDLGAAHPLTDAQASDVMRTLADPDALAVTLSPSTVTSALMTVNAQGSVRMETGGQPVGSAVVTASGLDAALGALNGSAKDDPTATQAAAVLTLAKQVGKAVGPDTYTWTIEASAGKPVTINGAPLSQPEPDGDPETKPDP